MGLVKVVVQLKNDIPDLKPEQYISIVQVRIEGDWRSAQEEQTIGDDGAALLARSPLEWLSGT